MERAKKGGAVALAGAAAASPAKPIDHAIHKHAPPAEPIDPVAFLARAIILVWILWNAYSIRLHAVNVYGRVIHEFDPWFNFRATDYLVNNGAKAFWSWYDQESWYPLGRPVGTTIYAGLQFTSAFIFYSLEALGMPMTLNDVCVFVPAWFGPITTIFVYGMTYETCRSSTSALIAAFFMSITPAHLMRSVAGGYDNESIAVAAICSTFYFWMRSIRDEASWPFAFLTAASYIYMVAAWGGYVFVLNMVGLSCGVILVCSLLGLTASPYSPGMWKAYSIFYIIGTIGAIQFPVVGLAPLKSLEQLAPAGLFLWMQLVHVCQMYKRRNPDLSEKQLWDFYYLLHMAAVGVALVFLFVLMPEGYLGPLSSRVRGLFVQHTRTGNPLVDSVAEHQATRDEMYYQYFHFVCYLGPVGFVSLFFGRTNAQMFMICYTAVAMYFSRKMIRLILVLGPASSVVGGIALEMIGRWCWAQIWVLGEEDEEDDVVTAKTPAAKAKAMSNGSGDKKKKGGKREHPFVRECREMYEQNVPLRKTSAAALSIACVIWMVNFWSHCDAMADNLSSPSIMILGRSQKGEPIMIDDFRESYWWLRDNTPQDARVLSWWDYGYQINGIANRTTIADGNTWNHEHIALLGRSLVSSVKKSHRIVRHLADYVLVWSTRFGGMWGDDIAKSPHMARIGGSVYKTIKPDEFYQDEQGNPSPMMKKSLIYTAVNYRLDPKIPEFPPDTYEEAFTSKNRMVRIYKVLKVSKKSKKYGKEGHGYKAWYAGKPLSSGVCPCVSVPVCVCARACVRVCVCVCV